MRGGFQGRGLFLFNSH